MALFGLAVWAFPEIRLQPSFECPGLIDILHELEVLPRFAFQRKRRTCGVVVIWGIIPTSTSVDVGTRRTRYTLSGLHMIASCDFLPRSIGQNIDCSSLTGYSSNDQTSNMVINMAHMAMCPSSACCNLPTSLRSRPQKTADRNPSVTSSFPENLGTKSLARAILRPY